MSADGIDWSNLNDLRFLIDLPTIDKSFQSKLCKALTKSGAKIEGTVNKTIDCAIYNDGDLRLKQRKAPVSAASSPLPSSSHLSSTTAHSHAARRPAQSASSRARRIFTLTHRDVGDSLPSTCQAVALSTACYHLNLKVPSKAKLGAKSSSSRRATGLHKGLKAPRSTSLQLKPLRTAFFKIEEMSGGYKPFACEFTGGFPRINYHNVPPSSPFATGVAATKPRSKKPTHRHRRNAKPVYGYCECCRGHYKNGLEQHRQEPQHLKFYNSSRNWVQCDTATALKQWAEQLRQARQARQTQAHPSSDVHASLSCVEQSDVSEGDLALGPTKQRVNADLDDSDDEDSARESGGNDDDGGNDDEMDNEGEALDHSSRSSIAVRQSARVPSTPSSGKTDHAPARLVHRPVTRDDGNAAHDDNDKADDEHLGNDREAGQVQSIASAVKGVDEPTNADIQDESISQVLVPDSENIALPEPTKQATQPVALESPEAEHEAEELEGREGEAEIETGVRLEAESLIKTEEKPEGETVELGVPEAQSSKRLQDDQVPKTPTKPTTKNLATVVDESFDIKTPPETRRSKAFQRPLSNPHTSTARGLSTATTPIPLDTPISPSSVRLTEHHERDSIPTTPHEMPSGPFTITRTRSSTRRTRSSKRNLSEVDTRPTPGFEAIPTPKRKSSKRKTSRTTTPISAPTQSKATAKPPRQQAQTCSVSQGSPPRTRHVQRALPDEEVLTDDAPSTIAAPFQPAVAPTTPAPPVVYEWPCRRSPRNHKSPRLAPFPKRRAQPNASVGASPKLERRSETRKRVVRRQTVTTPNQVVASVQPERADEEAKVSGKRSSSEGKAKAALVNSLLLPAGPKPKRKPPARPIRREPAKPDQFAFESPSKT
eukprot:m.157865 g.157865  ORF g.157865 m.157865 type:complete len:884 (+) comp16457_c0_seq1:153-2804(+)